MIESLTPEQESKLSVYRDKWLKIGLSTAPCDRQKAEAALEKVYAAANPPLEKPKKIIWLNSPLEGAIAAAAIVKDTEIAADQVGDEVWAQVWEQVRWQALEQVREQVRAQVWEQVREQAWDQVAHQVWERVRTQAWDQVGHQVWERVRTQAWDQVAHQVGGQVYTAGYGSHDAGWLSFFDFFKSECHIKGLEKLDGLFELSQNCGWWWPFNGLAILTERPIEIHMKDKKLHREGGPAILYKDGFSVYALNGVRVLKEIAETPANDEGLKEKK